jgi:hypothetical protein
MPYSSTDCRTTDGAAHNVRVGRVLHFEGDVFDEDSDCYGYWRPHVFDTNLSSGRISDRECDYAECWCSAAH